MTEKDLSHMVTPPDSESVRREVESTLLELFPGESVSLFTQAFKDVKDLFEGNYPGYLASNTKYHDHPHTCSVVIATARLIHGAILEGHECDQESALKGILAALFHDVGLIQTYDDAAGTGAKYTVGHEERSIQFMRENLTGRLTPDDMEDIADCIRCTILAMSPRKIAFRTETMRLMGNCLGSADLLAQIADRYYLEKLLLLFEEFQEARLPGYNTAYELLTKTRTFYQDVARPRLDNDMDQARRFMGTYFKQKVNVDHDPYQEAIHQNLNYLDTILGECSENIDCFRHCLRRGGFLQPSPKDSVKL